MEQLEAVLRNILTKCVLIFRHRRLELFGIHVSEFPVISEFLDSPFFNLVFGWFEVQSQMVIRPRCQMFFDNGIPIVDATTRRHQNLQARAVVLGPQLAYVLRLTRSHGRHHGLIQVVPELLQVAVGLAIPLDGRSGFLQRDVDSPRCFAGRLEAGWPLSELSS